jgi:hypothetical protein
MGELTFDLQSVKYQGKVYRGCTLYLNDDRKEARILARKNRIFFLNRQVYFLNRPISLLSITYDASTIIDVSGRSLTVNKDILMETSEQQESSKIADLISQPRMEVEVKTRQMLIQTEDMIRDFFETRQQALNFLLSVRQQPRKTMFGLLIEFAENPVEDPIGMRVRMYSDSLAKSMDDLKARLSEAESLVGKDRVERLCAIMYFISDLQDVFFDGKDPKRMGILKEFGLEIGFDETFFEELEKRSSPGDGFLDLFHNVRFVDLGSEAAYARA